MELWLQWARGPVFLFAFAFMLAGVARQVLLTLWEVTRAMRRAGDKTIPYRQVLMATSKWLLPFGKVKEQILFSMTSFIFHLAILIVPIFLAGHIALWARGGGITWPAVSNSVADVFTIFAVVTAVLLVVQRVAARATRELSRFQDYALPLLIAVPFASGFLVMHPSMNPFSYEAMLFTHIMGANLVFVLIPTTKLSHAGLIPGVQLVSEVAWHWPQDAGSSVAVTLGKDKVPI